MNITCSKNNFLAGLEGGAGWYLDRLKPVESPGCSGELGTSTGGNPFTSVCSDKISGIKYQKGSNLGSIQLICSDGLTKQKHGMAVGPGSGPVQTFMCPTGNYLSNITSNIASDGTIGGNLQLACQSESFNEPTIPEPSVPPADLTNAIENNEESGIPWWVWLIIALIIVAIFIGVLVYVFV